MNRIWVVGNGAMLNYKVYNKNYWNSVPGNLYIDVPQQVQDEQITVLAVLLEGPINSIVEWDKCKIISNLNQKNR